MRRLAQPHVLGSSIAAAGVTALACYPRLALWLNPSAPIWYLECAIFCCSIVLWAFVFGWHTSYSGRPVWIFKPDVKLVAGVTIVAIGLAVIFALFIDPSLKARLPEEFPADRQQWIARVLFSLFLTQLFVLYAPFAWLVRLVRNQKVAALLTVLFGAFILTIHMRGLSAVPLPLFAALLIGRLAMGILAVVIYLRGGILLASWWTLLLETRLLFELK